MVTLSSASSSLCMNACAYVAVDEVDDVLHRGARQENALDAHLFKLRDVHVGDDAADDDEHVVQALLMQELHDARTDMHVRSGQDRQPDHVGILLQRRTHYLLRRLPEARVNHLHAGVSKRTGNHLGPTVVAIEAWLGDNDADYLHYRNASGAQGPGLGWPEALLGPTGPDSRGL